MAFLLIKIVRLVIYLFQTNQLIGQSGGRGAVDVFHG